MKATYLYPPDLGCATEYDQRWIALITKLGYTGGNPWFQILIASIEVS